MTKINYVAWERNALAFIRAKGLEIEFSDWCGGWPMPPSENNPLGSAREPSEDGSVRDEHSLAAMKAALEPFARAAQWMGALVSIRAIKLQAGEDWFLEPLKVDDFRRAAQVYATLTEREGDA